MKINQNNRWILISGAVFALLSVALGAFAAHGLKSSLDSYSIGVFETAARYQMYHGLALCLCGVLLGGSDRLPSVSRRLLNYAAIGFNAGIILFSGSLYILAMTSMKWLGMVTPLGGICFILAWLLTIVAVSKA